MARSSSVAIGKRERIAAARERLEGWIHPRVRAMLRAGVEDARQSGRPRIVLDVLLATWTRERDPHQAERELVKAGVPAAAVQSPEERIDHDMYYIEHWSLMFDVRILVRTLVDGYVNAA